ncbi:MAG: cytochrome c-type biogenesis protein [Pseudohongiellaceae bacterium]
MRACSPTLVLAVLMLILAPAGGAQAQTAVDVFDFETEAQERRFQQLSEEFRCPMCQNANLADSPGGVAADLRREIYTMIMEGRTDEEIEQFMRARYGEFIFYRPRFDATTLLLWLGPLFFLLIGVFVIVGLVKRNRNAGVASEEDLSDDEKIRLKTLLHKRNDSRE